MDKTTHSMLAKFRARLRQRDAMLLDHLCDLKEKALDNDDLYRAERCDAAIMQVLERTGLLDFTVGSKRIGTA
jgi:hypothetical protein